MKFKIKYADQIVGLFVILSFVAFGMVVILLGINQRWFAKNYTFHTVFESSASLSPGTSIFMRGFQIGKIDRVKLNEHNLVDVDFHIFDTYYPKVREFSLLELSVSPIGLGTQLLFHPGRGADLLEEGSFIYTSDSPQGRRIIELELADIPPKDDTITRLLSNVNPLLENVNRTLTGVNRTITEINTALSGESSGPLGDIVFDIRDTTAQVPETMTMVNTLIFDAQGRLGDLLDQVQNILGESDTTMGHIAGITGNLLETTESLRDPTGLVPRLLDPQGSLDTLLNDDNQLFDSIMAMMAELEESVTTVGRIISSVNSEVPRLVSILNETKVAIELTQDVLEGVRNNPLIRGGIPERETQDTQYNSIRVRSFE